MVPCFAVATCVHTLVDALNLTSALGVVTYTIHEPPSARPVAAMGVAPSASALAGRGHVPLTAHALGGLKAVRSHAAASAEDTTMRTSVPTPPVASSSHATVAFCTTSAAGAANTPPAQALAASSGRGVGVAPPTWMGGAAL